MKKQTSRAPIHTVIGLLNSWLCLTAGCAWLATVTRAQSDDDAIEAARHTIKIERQAAVADALQLTDQESESFWPLYHRYRAEMDKEGDGVRQLVLEYARLHPDVPEERAQAMLKELLALEKQQAATRAEYLRKAGKILPATKALRLAQVETRLDLVVRMKLAANIPLVPVEGRLGGTLTGTAAFIEGAAGGTTVKTFRLQATVIALDAARRTVTLMDRHGFKQTVKAAPEVVNFDQIRLGDKLKLEVTEELVVRLGDETTAEGFQSTALVALAPVGAKPGRVVAEVRRRTAVVTALDPEKNTATLKFEDGSTRTFPVRKDVDLRKHNPGEKVVFQATEMIAIRIEKP